MRSLRQALNALSMGSLQLLQRQLVLEVAVQYARPVGRKRHRTAHRLRYYLDGSRALSRARDENHDALAEAPQARTAGEHDKPGAAVLFDQLELAPRPYGEQRLEYGIAAVAKGALYALPLRLLDGFHRSAGRQRQRGSECQHQPGGRQQGWHPAYPRGHRLRSHDEW